MEPERPIAVIGALLANLAITIVKFIAAAITGSSAMVSEGIHSAVDTGNQVLLLIGVHRSRRPPDRLHPFGYGKELYFWGLIVAIVLFGAGGGMSIYEGISHLQHPTLPGQLTWNYVVLGAAFVFDGISFLIARREIKRHHPRGRLWRQIHRSKDPSLFVVLMEDFTDLSGIIIAFLGIALTSALDSPLYDGLASILIGLLLAAVAVYLVDQSRQLLLGESAWSETRDSIHSLAEQDPDVGEIVHGASMHLGADSILLVMTIRFRPEISAQELMAAISRIKQGIQARHPQIQQIFIEPEQARS